mmetsp:Transcript_85149/g.264561  ORF Transcript_85149/g.264561 Transcript_85149/m.264561 type:complete len:248 (+) Transcript_85149:17-760(+)
MQAPASDGLRRRGATPLPADRHNRRAAPAGRPRGQTQAGGIMPLRRHVRQGLLEAGARSLGLALNQRKLRRLPVPCLRACVLLRPRMHGGLLRALLLGGYPFRPLGGVVRLHRGGHRQAEPALGRSPCVGEVPASERRLHVAQDHALPWPHEGSALLLRLSHQEPPRSPHPRAGTPGAAGRGEALLALAQRRQRPGVRPVRRGAAGGHGDVQHPLQVLGLLLRAGAQGRPRHYLSREAAAPPPRRLP